MALNDPSMFDDGTSANPPPPGLFGGFFIGIGSFVIVLSIVFGLLTLFCAINLQRRRRRTFCMVVAALTCLGVPLGTALGVFTLITLAKPDVQTHFDRSK